MTTRQNRVGSLIKREVAAFLLTEGYQEISGLVTITKVDVSLDMGQAKVYYSVVGQKAEEIERLFNTYIREIQRHLNHRLSMRKAPRIKLVLDQSGEYAAEISRLIDKLHENK